jgi:predicted ATPase
VTITGTGGIGKTRLAIALAAELVEEYPDGVWLVDLSPLREPALVVATIAQTLGARGELLDRLIEQRLLLVLDNFETVVEAAGDVARLLERAAGLTVVVASREPLHIGGEREYPLPPLAEAPAVELATMTRWPCSGSSATTSAPRRLCTGSATRPAIAATSSEPASCSKRAPP